MSAPSSLPNRPASAIRATPPERVRDRAGRVPARHLPLFSNDLQGMLPLSGAAIETSRILSVTDMLLAGLGE